jgi:hypothetical protein
LHISANRHHGLDDSSSHGYLNSIDQCGTGEVTL